MHSVAFFTTPYKIILLWIAATHFTIWYQKVCYRPKKQNNVLIFWNECHSTSIAKYCSPPSKKNCKMRIGSPQKQHVGQWFFLAKTFTKGSVQLLCKTRCPQRFSSCLLHFFTIGFLEQKIALGYGVRGGVWHTLLTKY